MTQSITQDNQNDKVLTEKIHFFFKRFRVTSVLKAANAYKKKGFPVVSVFQYLFATLLSSRIIDQCIYDLTSAEHVNAYIINDSMFKRDRSKKVELLTKVWDYVKARYCYGFCILTLG